jgi:hypothetical protein
MVLLQTRELVSHSLYEAFVHVDPHRQGRMMLRGTAWGHFSDAQHAQGLTGSL